jgi:hypothetical protein
MLHNNQLLQKKVVLVVWAGDPRHESRTDTAPGFIDLDGVAPAASILDATSHGSLGQHREGSFACTPDPVRRPEVDSHREQRGGYRSVQWTVRVATVVVAEPTLLVNTARYLEPC